MEATDMMKIERKKDREVFKGFARLVRIYSKEADAGRFYLFLPEDVLAETIDLESRKMTEINGEGICNLGKIAYCALTGTWEHNDPSIKLDGYPRIDSIMWPVLDPLVSEGGEWSLDKIEEGIEAFEKETDNDLEECDAHRITEEQTIGQEGRDAGELLDEVFKILENEPDGSQVKEEHEWLYDTGNSLVCLGANCEFLKDLGFIDRAEENVIGSWEAFYKGKDINTLKEILKGKRVISILDSAENDMWCLRVCRENEMKNKSEIELYELRRGGAGLKIALHEEMDAGEFVENIHQYIGSDVPLHPFIWVYFKGSYPSVNIGFGLVPSEDRLNQSSDEVSRGSGIESLKKALEGKRVKFAQYAAMHQTHSLIFSPI